MTTNTEKRPGAAGLPNAARASNKVRYQLGRAQYHLSEALKLSENIDEQTDLTTVSVNLKEIHDARPLSAGEDADTLGVKGKKAKQKAQGESE